MEHLWLLCSPLTSLAGSDDTPGADRLLSRRGTWALATARCHRTTPRSWEQLAEVLRVRGPQSLYSLIRKKN